MPSFEYLVARWSSLDQPVSMASRKSLATVAIDRGATFSGTTESAAMNRIADELDIRCSCRIDPDPAGFLLASMKSRGGKRAANPPGEEAEAHFAQLYDEHWGAVLAYALRRTQRPEDAADLVADTFLVAWRRAGDVPPEPDTRTWLYAVARRVLANHLRGQRRRVRLAERLRQDLVTASPSELATQREHGAMKALGRLEEKDREVLLLAGWEELGPAEIARVLGIGGAATRSRLHRARKRFKAELEAESQEARLSAPQKLEET